MNLLFCIDWFWSSVRALIILQLGMLSSVMGMDVCLHFQMVLNAVGLLENRILWCSYFTDVLLMVSREDGIIRINELAGVCVWFMFVAASVAYWDLFVSRIFVLLVIKLYNTICSWITL